MTADSTDPTPAATPPGLPLDRRAGLARETVRLIRDMSESLVVQAHEARRASREAGDPRPVAAQVDALVAAAERLRAQGEQLSRAFAVLDRLVPPEPPTTSPAAAGSPADGEPPEAVSREAVRPQAASRRAAVSLALALKLEGGSAEDVETRLLDEFGRSDAREIVAEVFSGARPDPGTGSTQTR